MSNSPVLKIKKLFDDSIVPVRAHPTDSGLDLYAYKFEKLYEDDISDLCQGDIPKDVTEIVLNPGNRVLINCGISATVGIGYEIQIRPRSGLALKRGLTVLNSPGTIDFGYRGPICVILINHSKRPQIIKKSDKIAQMVVCPVTLCPVEVVSNLDDTDRGAGGFGSTGA